MCTGAIAVLTELLDNSLLEHTQKAGKYLKKKLTELLIKYDTIKNIRGIGLMLGIELSQPAGDIVSACREKGLLLATAGPSVIRFVPPLIVTEEDIDKAVSILDKVIQKQ